MTLKKEASKVAKVVVTRVTVREVASISTIFGGSTQGFYY